MMAPSLAEAAGRLALGLQVLIGRRPAMDAFGDTRDDVVKSFWIALPFFPLYLWALVSSTPADSVFSDVGLPTRLFVHSISYAYVWVYWPLIMAGVSTLVGKPDRWAKYVAAMNWTMAIPFAIQLFMILAIDPMMPSVSEGVRSLVRIWALGVHALMIQTFFKTGVLVTLLLVVADFVLALVLGQVEVFVILSNA